MRAIIIDDKDAVALLDKLKLESFDQSIGYGIELNEAWQSLPLSLRREMIDKVHRRFHYVVTTWLQDQGANVTR